MSRFTIQASRNHASTRRAGYSIVELLVVVLILGIISINVAPRFVATLGRHRVSSAARRIKLDIEQVRLRAQTTATFQSIVFAPSLNAYFLPNVTPIDPKQSVYRVNLSQSVGNGPAFVSVELPIPNDTELQFNASGVPDSAGQIALRAGDYQQSVLVADTGHVELGPVVWVP